ncbi:MAG: hypothetical protein MO852_09325 [Candidatus Devosia euplotis]|nr:hypothetical protein [Candidatus Devosia euplotis]
MRRDLALSRIIDGYRSVAIAAAVAIVSSFVASLLVLFDWVPGQDAMLPVVTLMAGMVVLGFLAAGHCMVRTRVAAASKTSRDIIASVHRYALTGVATRSYFLETLRNKIYHGSERPVGYL